MNDEPETNGATEDTEEQQEEEPQGEQPQEQETQVEEEDEEPQDEGIQNDSKEEAAAGEEKDHLTLDFEEALPDDVSYADYDMATCLIRKFAEQQKLLLLICTPVHHLATILTF